MSEQQIRFEDGAAYERVMGVWSRMAGEVFLDWLAPAPGLRWLDVGCGSGAFTQLVSDRCAPAALDGIDPSAAQLAFARTRPAGKVAQFRHGDAMALPFPDNSFDAAVMALVIFFVPEPARGVTEMVRVVAPGGTVAAYAWDQTTGGTPLAPIQAELRAMGYRPPQHPSGEASAIDALRELWLAAALEGVETREIRLTRAFPDFDAFWADTAYAPATAAIVAALSREESGQLKARVRAQLDTDAAGRVICRAHANAVKGHVPR